MGKLARDWCPASFAVDADSLVLIDHWGRKRLFGEGDHFGPLLGRHRSWLLPVNCARGQPPRFCGCQFGSRPTHSRNARDFLRERVVAWPLLEGPQPRPPLLRSTP